MSSLHPSEIAFLKDLAQAKESWVSTAIRTMEEPNDLLWSECPDAWKCVSACLCSENANEYFRSVVSELLSGLVHSILVSLDGGSALAETTLISVTDEDHHEFKRFLHEYWPEFSNASKV